MRDVPRRSAAGTRWTVALLVSWAAVACGAHGTPATGVPSPASPASPAGTTGTTATASPLPAAVPPPVPAPVSAAQTTRLPTATTLGRLTGTTPDPHPFATPGGLVVHPTRPAVVYARPGGVPIAVLPTTELGSPTWLPVIERESGWERVLLPSRPNRSTGWLPTASGLLHATSGYRVRVELAARRLTLSAGGRQVGSWTVAVGAPGTPTPTGRTFLLASLAPTPPDYSPLILPLGAHSATLDSFGGGPGTVALHGWPDPGVFGHDVSHGCVRVPADALTALARVPLGSAVLISP